MLKDQIALYAYPFEGYWKDVGTIDSLWQANMDLLADEPPLDLSDPDWRIYAGNQSMPPHFIGPKGSVKSALIAEGAAILGQVSDSVIFIMSLLKKAPGSPIRLSCPGPSSKPALS